MRATLVLLTLASAATASWEPTYADACKRCQHYRCPLVVGVGCAAPDDKAWVTCSVRDFKGHDYDPAVVAPCIVLAMPWKDYPVFITTLPSTATAADIRAAIPKVWVVPKAAAPDPFKKYNPAAQPSFQQRMRQSAISVRGGNC